ncbi:ribosome silencing factor [Oceanotoga sp. DSM 15011]|uniref:Ribosomal silencing factor RsfS n=1 Tax=Oceanotoga teriensis TaxID=515440 RepID=A0AA45C8G5_9BACT|nr:MULTISPECIES: ribosome silencing factor [Oceanotoga]MDN5342445.1 ribosome-associated protein [Oceanotoga sp.]MDO7975602.1 ribosome silencing factor [Oceanotoga teriensis]PWJ96109.1 ribosome-associated protein [Oceanotoga teriensis]UYO99891.1 ribosome silencing factor [Oceanotoga sp. DSM 15011]
MLKEEVKKNVDEIKEIMEKYDAEDIKIFDMEKSSLLVDYFVIVTGNSDTHMNALRDYVVKYLKENEIKLTYHDKTRGSDWLVVDTGNIIVHIFSRDGREFYDLDSLWSKYLLK